MTGTAGIATTAVVISKRLVSPVGSKRHLAHRRGARAVAYAVARGKGVAR